MGIITAPERRSSLSNPEGWLIRMVGGRDTAAGIQVDEQSALSLLTVFAGVRLIAETVGSVPVKLFEAIGRSKLEARSNSLWALLHDEPNPEQTPFEFYEMLQGYVELSGGGYAEIVRTKGSGRPIELWPIPTHRLKPERARDNSLYYRITDPRGGPDRVLPMEDVLAVRGISRDGVRPLHPIDTARESLGIALALERFAGGFFGNGAMPGGILSSPKGLSPEAKKKIRASWDDAHRGSDRAFRVALLEDGLEWKNTTVNPKDAQALDSRKYSVTEVARLLNLPPHMLKDMEHATFSNVEHQAIEFVTVSMRPRFRRFAQALEKKLILPSQRGRLYIEHIIEELLVGDIKMRYEAYAVARQNGWMNANEIRSKENHNPYDGGDEYLTQLNMVPVRLLAGLYEAPEGEDPAAVRNALLEVVRRKQERAYVHLFRDAAARCVRAEVGAVRKAVKRSNGAADQVALRTAIDAAYEEQAGLIRRAFTPALLTYTEAIGYQVAGERAVDPTDLQSFAVRYAAELATRQVERSLEELGVAMRDTDPDIAIDIVLDRWEATRAEEMAPAIARALAEAVETFMNRRLT